MYYYILKYYILINHLGDLPENLFFESGGANKNNSTKTKKVSATQEAADKSIQTKNETIAFCVLTETVANISTTVRDLKASKRKLQKEFVEDGCDGDKERAKIRLDKYFDRQSNKENDIYEAPDSQESLLEDIYQIEQDIETQKEVMSVAKKSLKKKSISM